MPPSGARPGEGRGQDLQGRRRSRSCAPQAADVAWQRFGAHKAKLGTIKLPQGQQPRGAQTRDGHDGQSTVEGLVAELLLSHQLDTASARIPDVVCRVLRDLSLIHI